MWSFCTLDLDTGDYVCTLLPFEIDFGHSSTQIPAGQYAFGANSETLIKPIGGSFIILLGGVCFLRGLKSEVWLHI